MTGYRNDGGGEYVLPITVDVMEAFGHRVIERLDAQTSLEELLRRIASMVFQRQEDICRIDLDHFERTKLRETVPHGGPVE